MEHSTSTINKRLLASPRELPLALTNIGSPAYSTRYESTEPMPAGKYMEDSPKACGPPKNMASLLSPPPSAPNSPPKSHAVPELTVDHASPHSHFDGPATPEPSYRQPETYASYTPLPRIQVNDDIVMNDVVIEKPKKEEYAIFYSAVMELYHSNPKKWLKQERRYMSNITPHYSANRVQKSNNVAPRSRPLAPAPRQSMPSQAPVKPRPRVARTPRATPKVRASLESTMSETGGSPSAQFRLVQAKSKAPVSREDVEFDSIPDYCPPLDTLPNNKCLKTEWKGQALNLDNDPHKHLLHPAEVQLASTLRLSCASYLTSKRRIFQEKVQRTRNGQEFRKTDSQKACKIDVNKASKLWASFERVGWFQMKYIQKFV